MAKITLAALNAQFMAEKSLTAAAIKEIESRLEAQQRQIRAAFARIEALEKELAAKSAAAADSRLRQRSGWRPSYIAAVEAARRNYPGKAIKVVGGTVYAWINDDWHAA